MEYLRYLVVFLLVGFCVSQKTYKRGCECEYTVDGKCAYTLMLPANQMSTCPKTDNDQWPKNIASIEEHIEMINNNITNIRTMSSQQSQSLNVLQSAVLSQTVLVQNITARIDSLSDCTNCKASGNCDECNALLEQQSVLIQNLQTEVSRIDTVLNAFRNDINLARLIEDSDDITRVVNTKFPEVEKKVENLETQVTATKVQVETMSTQMSCQRRGLLVSGEDVSIGDEFITVSSADSSNTEAVRARIRTQKEGDLAGAWCSGYVKDTSDLDIGCIDANLACPYWAEDGECQRNPTYMNKYCSQSCKVPCAEPNQDEWLMFNLGTPKTIFGVVTRGRQDYAQWVTAYRVLYTNQLAGNETLWNSYTDPIGAEQLFVGNSDKHTLQTNMLWQPFTAQYVRLVPVTANENNRCMRADLIGCVDS